MTMQALYDWASAQTARPVIFANQDGGQPETPYVTLQVIAGAREGMPYIGCPDANGTATIEQGQLLSVSVNVYGEGATGLVQTLRNSLERITVQQLLRASGLAFVRVLSGPQDLPEITGTTYQKRAQMDVQFRAGVAFDDDVGLIETVEFDGETVGE